MIKHSFKQELRTIRQMARNNGYSEKLIDNLLIKKRREQAVSLSRNMVQDPFYETHLLQYLQKLPKDKFRVAFYTPINLSRLLCKKICHRQGESEWSLRDQV
jgi:hypothetical protein